MPRIAAGLTDLAIKNAKIKEKEYIKSDGYGLQIRIRPNGSKTFQFVYAHPITRKKCKMSLGAYPLLSLKEAKKITLTYNELVATGIDPKTKKEELKKAHIAINEHTLKNIAAQWLEMKKHDITEDYAEDIWRSLELHVFPHLANTPIKDINALDTIAVLRPLEAKGKLETIKRVSQRLNEVMDYAVNHGMIKANPLAGIRKVFKKPAKVHLATIEPEQLSDFMNRLANASIHISTRCLIEFQLHTLTRPAEASSAEWAEFDFENREWTIPPHKMKYYRKNQPETHRPHHIPLSDQVIRLLEIMKPATSHSSFVFASRSLVDKPVNSQTANMALKRMGYDGELVSHGLRSIGSTVLHEQTDFESKVVEATLSHIVGNESERAYRRGKNFFKKRIPIMKWWSDYIEAAASGNLSLTHRNPIEILGD